MNAYLIAGLAVTGVFVVYCLLILYAFLTMKPGYRKKFPLSSKRRQAKQLALKTPVNTQKPDAIKKAAPLITKPVVPLVPLAAPPVVPLAPLAAPPVVPLAPLAAPPVVPLTPLAAPPVVPLVPLAAPPVVPLVPLAPLAAQPVVVPLDSQLDQERMPPSKDCRDDVDLDDAAIAKLIEELGISPSMYQDLTNSALDEFQEHFPNPVSQKTSSETKSLYNFT
jgi:hypothetical protein